MTPNMTLLAMRAYLRLQPSVILSPLKNLLDLTRNTDYHLSPHMGCLQLFYEEGRCLFSKVHRPPKIKNLSCERFI
jgi:hypothetical protein